MSRYARSRVGGRISKYNSLNNFDTCYQPSDVTTDSDSVDSNAQQDYRFFCQLAHGSPTGIIHGFRTVRQLYAKIAECFDLPVSQIMFCTRNTHKLDMDSLLCNEVGLNDFLFAHIRGQPKEIHIRKEANSFGLTLTDNGCGVVLIKRIQPGGLMDRVSQSCGGLIQIGDQIERVNNISFSGRRHYHVASYLQSISVGEVFCLRLVSPERSPIYMLQPRTSRGSRGANFGSGKRTIRLKQNGEIEEGEIIDSETVAIQRINRILGNSLGFEDSGLAYAIYSLAKISIYPDDLKRRLNEEFYELDLTSSNLVNELWRVVNLNDYRRNPSTSSSTSSSSTVGLTTNGAAIFPAYYPSFDLRTSL